MGKEAQAQLSWPDGRTAEGRLQYEPPKLVFRGPPRLAFAADQLAGVTAEGRELVLASGERFRLPTPAQSWADAILRPKGRLEKLGVKPGMRVGVIHLDDPEFAAELATVVTPAQSALLDILFYGADSPEDLALIASQAARLAEGGALWVASLKGKAATLKDTDVMAAAKANGLVDNKVCAFSPTRTALRFVRRRT
jgi:hypothetical protein